MIDTAGSSSTAAHWRTGAAESPSCWDTAQRTCTPHPAQEGVGNEGGGPPVTPERVEAKVVRSEAAPGSSTVPGRAIKSKQAHCSGGACHGRNALCNALSGPSLGLTCPAAPQTAARQTPRTPMPSRCSTRGQGSSTIRQAISKPHRILRMRPPDPVATSKYILQVESRISTSKMSPWGQP